MDLNAPPFPMFYCLFAGLVFDPATGAPVTLLNGASADANGVYRAFSLLQEISH